MRKRRIRYWDFCDFSSQLILLCTFFGPGGEMQEADVYLPVLSHKYTMDLSRTRSYFLPGYPLDVVVCMELTNGYTAKYMTVMGFVSKRFCLLLL